MCGICVSTFGLSSNEFYDLTPIEYKYAIITTNNREESLFKLRYEIARFIAKHIWNAAGKSLKKGKYLKTGKEVEPFYWETDEQGNVLPDQQELKHKVLNMISAFKHLPDKSVKTKEKQ
jgi:hypothetical protein